MIIGCQNCWQTMMLGFIGLGGVTSYFTCKIAGWVQFRKTFKKKAAPNE